MQYPYSHGGTSIVYKCRSRFYVADFAVKLIPFCDRCEKEVYPEVITAFLHHPNILRCYGLWVENSVPPGLGKVLEDNGVTLECGVKPNKTLYLLMELCQGNLSAVLAKKEFNAQEIKKVLLDCAQGLLYLHTKKKKLHGDISLNNIFIDFEGNAKLGDFGGVVDNDDIIRHIGGTRRYLAPEVKNLDMGVITKASDIYSLALVIIEVIYRDKTLATGFERELFFNEIKAKIFPDQKVVPDPLIVTLQEMLDSDPKNRPSAEYLISSLGKP